MYQLKEQIRKLPKGVAAALSEELLDKLYSVYPFNRFEYIISHLIAERIISLQDYLEIRNNYASGVDDQGNVVDKVTVVLVDDSGIYFEPMYFQVPNYFYTSASY